jgi:hypothetical protein
MKNYNMPLTTRTVAMAVKAMWKRYNGVSVHNSNPHFFKFHNQLQLPNFSTVAASMC